MREIIKDGLKLFCDSYNAERSRGLHTTHWEQIRCKENGTVSFLGSIMHRKATLYNNLSYYGIKYSGVKNLKPSNILV